MEKFETKHTPGPWFPVQYAKWWNLQQEPFYGENDLLDAEVAPAEANAKLAAAAPLLLSALIKAVEDVNEELLAAKIRNENGIDASLYELPDWYDDAVAAIQAAISQPENVKG